MRTVSSGVAYGLAAAGGIALWTLTALLSGRAEAWDSALYWQRAYPLALACALLLGYLAPVRAWRWGLTLMLVQVLPLVLGSGSGSMLPLGLMLLGFLAVPPIGLALLGAKVRR